MTIEHDPHTPSLPAFDHDSFRGRAYLVTGGAHGIGLAVVRQLLAVEANVVLLDFDKSQLDPLRDELADRADRAVCMYGDVTEEGTLEQAINAAGDKWGRLDGIVNNAMLNALLKIDMQPDEDFTRTWEVNVLAAWRLIKLTLPLLDVRGGSVVNISSIMAHHTWSSNAAYSSSKAALEGLTRQLAVELGERFIRVNAIAPGFIDTARGINRDRPGVDPAVIDKYVELSMKLRTIRSPHLNAIRRHGKPDDIAGPVLFLLSDASKFVTGTTLMVDGGTSCIIMPGRFPREVHEVSAELAQFIEDHPEIKGMHPTKPSPAILNLDRPKTD